jgi:hypothetical protein
MGAMADDVAADLDAIAHPSVEPMRAVRRAYSRRLRATPGPEVVAVALALRDRHRWVAYELVYHHPGALSALDPPTVERFGAGMAGWVDVDAFGRYVSGPAWRRDRIDAGLVHGWAARPDRWWRRAALVSTVPLNLRAAGGTGDTARTVPVCELLVDDRDDMVVKALSWALRALVEWDAPAVRRFLADHGDGVAARVRREVTTKLETGRKQRPRRP